MDLTSSKANITLIKIPGNSGCTIEVKGQTLIKSTTDPKYVERLETQAIQQKRFSCLLYSNIIVPRIERIQNTGNECHVYMQYITALDFVEKFQRASKKELDHILETLFRFIDQNLKEAKHRLPVPKAVFVNKINSIHANDFLKSLVIKRIPDILELPITSWYHGDLTFSNILFQQNKLVLIDFLDTYLATPFLDIVKLRQDTVYKWSLDLYPRDYDKVKLDIVLKYIDNAIVDRYQNEYFFQYYNIMQMINLLRIYPYTRDYEIICKLNKSIYYLLKDEDQRNRSRSWQIN